MYHLIRLHIINHIMHASTYLRSINYVYCITLLSSWSIFIRESPAITVSWICTDKFYFFEKRQFFSRTTELAEFIYKLHNNIYTYIKHQLKKHTFPRRNLVMLTFQLFWDQKQNIGIHSFQIAASCDLNVFSLSHEWQKKDRWGN